MTWRGESMHLSPKLQAFLNEAHELQTAALLLGIHRPIRVEMDCEAYGELRVEVRSNSWLWRAADNDCVMLSGIEYVRKPGPADMSYVALCESEQPMGGMPI